MSESPVSLSTSPTIDRESPRRRPDGEPVGWQQWRDLTFLHWPVDAQVLRKVVPHRLELDLWEGTAYVGIVPFLMQRVQPFRWWPAALGFRFLETNVRTYVIHREEPAVYFLSLDAASRLAVQAARWMWGLPYFHAQMELSRDGDCIRYESQRRGAGMLNASVDIGDPLPASQEGTPAFFFLERYLLMVERKRKLFRGQVHHSPYVAHSAHCESIDETLMPAVGLPSVSGAPKFAHYSPGVDVEIFGLTEVGRV